MKDESGGFYSSYDADSEGEEGKFYIWRKAELDSILPASPGREMLYQYYGISNKGNWEHGNNILHAGTSVKDFAKKNKMSRTGIPCQCPTSEAHALSASGKTYQTRFG